MIGDTDGKRGAQGLSQEESGTEAFANQRAQSGLMAGGNLVEMN